MCSGGRWGLFHPCLLYITRFLMARHRSRGPSRCFCPRVSAFSHFAHFAHARQFTALHRFAEASQRFAIINPYVSQRNGPTLYFLHLCYEVTPSRCKSCSCYLSLDILTKPKVARSHPIVTLNPTSAAGFSPGCEALSVRVFALIGRRLPALRWQGVSGGGGGFTLREGNISWCTWEQA